MSLCGSRMLHMLSWAYLCAKACHAVWAWAGLCEALCQKPSGQAIVRCGQGSIILQQVPCAATFPMVQAGRRGRGVRDKGLRSGLNNLTKVSARKSFLLHFELLAVTLRQHTCVGERKPATPEKKEDRLILSH